MGEMLATATTLEVSILPSNRSDSTSFLGHRSSSPLVTSRRDQHASSDNTAGRSKNLLTTFDFSRKSKALFYTADGGVLTYGDFDQSIRRYAVYLKERYKIGKGDRIAAQVNKSTDTLALYLATLRLGAVYVPLNTDYKKDEISYFLLNSEPSVFVCRRNDYETYVRLVSNGYKTASIKCTILDEEELAENVRHARPDDVPVEKMGSDDLAAILYTSGTTGQPKGAMVTHGNLSSNAQTLCQIWRITENDILLHAMPVYHAHGLFVAVNPILTVGASVILLPRFELNTVLRALPKSTLMMGVPTYYTRLLNSEKLNRNLLEHIRLFVSGSAPLLDSTWREFKERTGHEILERYGMTEGQMVCSVPYEGPRKPGTVGRPLPGVSVRIRNSSLEYKGPNLFKGYWRMPEKTKDEFTEDGYFISGDLAEFDENGYVKIMGRGKDLIITGGLNVYPKEIEYAIDSMPGVVESAVIGVSHSDFGEAVVAVVVLQDGTQRDKNQEHRMIAELKDRIATFKVPKRIFSIKQLPRNVMGKVQKNVLRDTYRNVFSK